MNKKVLLIAIAVFLLTNTVSFITGLWMGISGTEIRIQEEQNKKPNYTGQEIQDAINIYRKEKGLTELKVNSLLCNGLVDRYLVFQTPEALKEGHPGFEAWAKTKFKEGFSFVGEVYSTKPTTQEVIDGWKASPAHNETITNPKYTEVCTYAGADGVVMVLGIK